MIQCLLKLFNFTFKLINFSPGNVHKALQFFILANHRIYFLLVGLAHLFFNSPETIALSLYLEVCGIGMMYYIKHCAYTHSFSSISLGSFYCSSRTNFHSGTSISVLAQTLLRSNISTGSP